MKPRILPRDVVTRWNSTYYMLDFAFKYRAVVDAMTADKSLKLRKFELEDEEWLVVEDLVAILKVTTILYCSFAALTLMHRNIKMRPSSFPRTRPASRQLFLLWIGLQTLSTSRPETHITLQLSRP
jgi:hypothetical protein